MRKIILLAFSIFSIVPIWGQTTVACSPESGVQTAVNGLSAGATLTVLPAAYGTCTWSSTLTVNTGIILQGSGTANNLPSQFGVGSPTTHIIQNTASGLPLIQTNGITQGNFLRISNFTFDPPSSSTLLIKSYVVSGVGVCNGSGCPNIRVDNIYFGPNVAYTNNSGAGGGNGIGSLIALDNFFGVVDHNTLSVGTQTEFVNPHFSAYLGVGDWGDNSWATADSIGGLNQVYLENNIVNNNWILTDTEFIPAGAGANEGGGRLTCRFNQVTSIGGSFGTCGGHGLDTDGRPQGVRQMEVYGNTISCNGGSNNCGSGGASFRSGGTGMVWGNTYTGAQAFGTIFDFSVFRLIGSFDPSWSYCGGVSASPYDTNDTADVGLGAGIFYTGTVTSVGFDGSGNPFYTVAGSPWTTNQWAPTGAPYSVYDVTRGFFDEVASNTSGTITGIQPINESCWFPGFVPSCAAQAGDTIQIQRAFVCVDQGGRGGGNLVSGTSPITPQAAVNQALRSVHEFADSTSGAIFRGRVFSETGKIIANRDFYTDGGAGVQVSSSSPFNGTSGDGWGTLANRPSTCTTGVGYFATDQGSWNTSGIDWITGFRQGVLYQCVNSGTPWSSTPYYTPLTYPHPLIGGASSFTLTVSTAGTGTGTLGGSNCSSGTYASGTGITCTETPSAGSSFVNWTGGTCSGSGACSFSLTGNSVVTANFQITPASTPTFSPTAGTVAAGTPVTVSTATGSATIYCTVDGTTPTTSSPVYRSPLYLGANETLQCIATASGFGTSLVGSSAYTVTPAIPSVYISMNASANTPVPAVNRIIAAQWADVLQTPASDCNTYKSSWGPLAAWLTASSGAGAVNWYTFDKIPQCANGTTNTGNPPNDIGSGDTFFKNFVTAFMNHICPTYSGTPLPYTSCSNMQYIELWNERNVGSYWTGTAPQAAVMSSDAIPIIRSRCSTCIIVMDSASAGGSGTGGQYDSWLLSEMSSLTQFPDMAGFHPYPSRTTVENVPFPMSITSNNSASCTGTSNLNCYMPMYQQITNFQTAVLANAAISAWAKFLPIVLSEGGYGINDGVCDTGAVDCNEAHTNPAFLRAAYASQWILTLAAQHPLLTMWYVDQDQCWGTVKWNGGAPGASCPNTPAATIVPNSQTQIAINQTNTWLTSATVSTPSCAASICTMNGTRGGLAVQWAWYQGFLGSTSYTTTFGSQQNLQGTVTPTGGSVTLTMQPILLSGAPASGTTVTTGPVQYLGKSGVQ